MMLCLHEDNGRHGEGVAKINLLLLHGGQVRQAGREVL